MHALIRDLRLSFRLMRKAPAFTTAVVLTLALGIGVTTAIFTVVDATLVRGLPYPEPDRLVQITMTKREAAGEMEASYPTFLDWKEQSASFESLAGYSGSGGVASFATEPSRPVQAAVVTADFFRTLGVTPSVGRDFTRGDEDLADKKVVLLAHGVWQRQFGSDPRVIGTTLTFNGSSHTIIGVLPAGFAFAPIAPAELYIPVERLPFQMRRNLHWLNVVGRLAPGVSLGEASAEMAAISERLGQQYPQSNRDTGARIVPLRESILGDVEPIMLLLFGAAGLLLLIACVNVATLMLARSASRQREIAVRVALGASRMRLLRQSVTEGLALSGAGAIAGIILAQWVVGGLLAVIPESLLRFMPYLTGVHVDARALAFTAGLIVLTGVLFGLAPAVQGRDAHPHAVLSGNTRGTAGSASDRTRSVLVAAQVALAVVLLAGAVLTTRSLFKMLHQDPGFDKQRLAILRTLLPQERYPDAPRMVAALRGLHERLAAMPGVEGVGMTNRTPFQAGNTVRFRLEHEPAQSAGEQAEAPIRSVDAFYFQVLGAKLLRGRYFDRTDERDGPPVLIINRTLAEQTFPGVDAVGRRLVFTFAPDQPPREIVGVIDDVREGPLDAAPEPAIYTPLMRTGARVVDIVLRSSADPVPHLTSAEHAVKQFDPGLLLLRKTTMEAVVADAPWVFFRRYPATLTSLFAVAALLLAGVGLFGLISYTVTQRTREIGVRIALGARPADVLHLTMRQGLKPAVAGILGGMALALALARGVEHMLFGVSATDPLTFAVMPVVVTAMAVLAVYVPARRATKLDPVAAFRHE